jgi:hypothetical protein
MDGSTASPSWLITAPGQTRLSGAMLGSSVKPPKADIWRPAGNVAEVPISEVMHRYSGSPALRSPSAIRSKSAWSL